MDHGRELSRRLGKDPKLSGISVLAVDSAAMPTEISRRNDWARGVFLAQIVLKIVAVITTLNLMGPSEQRGDLLVMYCTLGLK